MPVLLDLLQRRIERSCARLGVRYPWWIPVYSTLGAVAISVVAYVQRGAFTTAPAVVVAGVLLFAPLLVWCLTAWLLPPWLESISTMVAAALLLTHPVAADFAPLLFLISAGETAATSKPWLAVVVSAADVGVLVAAAGFGHLDSAPLYVVGVVLGLAVGIALRWQMRALNAEQANAVAARDQAVLAERQRLARDVHDVVGHSLSITLLHVTGARHSLQQHGDIGDAIESLTEAERVGRAAMGDLRRTIGVLASGPAETQAPPGLADLPALVERARHAGLDIDFACAGEPAGVGSAAGLGLYRIVQESLANIAKHAPAESASVRLAARVGGARLTVRNTLPAGYRANGAGGAGLPGMAARAAQMGAELRAGRDGDCWLVDVDLPTVA